MRRFWGDAAVSAGLAVTVALSISSATEVASREPDALAYAIGLLAAVVLPLRRRWPVGAIAAPLAVLMAYYSFQYPAFPPALVLAPSAYFAALAGRLLPASALLGTFSVFTLGWQTLGEDSSLASVLGTSTLPDAALVAVVLLLGETIRTRRAWAEEVRERLRMEADHRLEEERLRIARELHDVMAHTITTVTVQANVARDVIDDDPAEAKHALTVIHDHTAQALAELRAAVGVLRAGDAPRSPAPGLDDLGGLVATASGAGVRVDVAIDGEARTLPRAIELTAYRIVQESLTNVVRHARATAARVVLRYGPGALEVEVTDDGATTSANGRGFGLAGMHERAAAVGGTCDAGRAPDGGFRVHAHLPTP